MNAQEMREIRTARDESQSQFARTLAEMLGKTYHLSKTYISHMEAGRKPITDEIANACRTLAARLDGMNETQASARPYTIMSTRPIPPNTITTATLRPCALVGCPASFLPASPRQKYCKPECRAEAARLRRSKD